ncbi:hypothetical protein AVEN_265202-1 [Araneus ventricosus]|uniref:Uncharacterized protein n=1 Tax=Araneus ventricosus TaxID=182803 RepID=A0A4Y2CQF9_ARAVE|nr:hypothetical protein AVEN_265202-1 [Araneus ventricosus]
MSSLRLHAHDRSKSYPVVDVENRSESERREAEGWISSGSRYAQTCLDIDDGASRSVRERGWRLGYVVHRGKLGRQEMAAGVTDGE